jgi:flagellin
MKINNFMNTSASNNYQNNINKTLGMIASGVENKIDDAASASISSMLSSEVAAMGQGMMNLNDGISMMQIADGTTTSLSKNAAELNAMSVRYNSAALNTQDRAALQSDFNALAQSMQQSIDSTTYNNKALFGSDISIETSQGLVNASVGAIDTQGLDITSMESIVAFQNRLSSVQSDIGSNTNGMISSANALQQAFVSTSAAKSQLEDTDIADMVMQLQQNAMKLETSTLAQVHQTSLLQQQMSRLLGQ